MFSASNSFSDAWNFVVRGGGYYFLLKVISVVNSSASLLWAAFARYFAL